MEDGGRAAICQKQRTNLQEEYDANYFYHIK